MFTWNDVEFDSIQIETLLMVFGGEVVKDWYFSRDTDAEKVNEVFSFQFQPVSYWILSREYDTGWLEIPKNTIFINGSATEL